MPDLRNAFRSANLNADFMSMYATCNSLVKFWCSSGSNLRANMASMVDRPGVNQDCSGLWHLSNANHYLVLCLMLEYYKL